MSAEEIGCRMEAMNKSMVAMAASSETKGSGQMTPGAGKIGAKVVNGSANATNSSSS